jgi:hypothetical protein
MGKAKLPPKRKRPAGPAAAGVRTGTAHTSPRPAPGASLEELARRQGVKPYTGVQDFAGLWPEEFDPDAFLEWLAAERRARREAAASKPRAGGAARRKKSA